MPSTNISALTATDLGTNPFTLTQDVSDTSGPNYDVWFKYTAAVDESVFGFYASASLAGNYTPSTTIWTGPAATPVFYMPNSLDIENVPVSVPCTPGETYYFRVRQAAVGVPNVNLSIDGQIAPSGEIPVGSLMINDDVTGFPVVALSAVNGLVLNLVPNFPAGEGGQPLADGTLLVENTSALQLVLYSAALEYQTSLAFPTGLISNIGLGSDHDSLFYVGSGSSVAPPVVASITSAGVVQDTWSLPVIAAGALRGVAPSRDNTILYYIITGVNFPVKRYDLINSIGLSDLVAGVATYTTKRDVLVLGDGTILAGYTKAATASELRRYSTAGALLSTYTLGATDFLNRFTHAIDDPVSFWTWSFTDPGNTTSRFANIRVSDGAVLTTFDVVQFQQGVYAGTATASPIRFGHSDSCPFWIQREATTPEPSAEVGLATTLPIRWVLRTGVIT